MTASSKWGRVMGPDIEVSFSLNGWTAIPGGSSELLIWLPPDDLASELMEGFHLPLRCYRGTDGVRRFSPVGVMKERRPAAQGASCLVRRVPRLGLARRLCCALARVQVVQRTAFLLSPDVVPVPAFRQDAGAHYA